MGESISNFNLDVFPEFDPIVFACVPACPGKLWPYVGKKVLTLDEGFGFYEAGMDELGKSLLTRIHELSLTDKGNTVEDFYFIEKVVVVELHPPSVVSTKGSASDPKSRLVSAKEKAIKLNSKPLSQCKKCGELGHHDSWNCGRQKGK
ncbi:hypothetical protein SASPL_112411 [Salvia splendens]|uniref:Uncharacterized protein n=1 Tax=Salvia splendens TaxID=180675 RepID=A0A8X9A392_SALSN|nr:hypothetical protein SASPL_112411 [Salvia splendens]